MGNTNRPFYRLVAIDSRKRRDGRAIEELGFYDPLKQPAIVNLKEEPILEWLNRGALPSPTVNELLRDKGILMKWKMLRAGSSAEEATQKVAAFLENRVEKPTKARISKKERAKIEAASEKASEQQAAEAVSKSKAETTPAEEPATSTAEAE